MHYWIVINNEQRGPLTVEQLRIFPEFGPSTPVWRQGLADWTTAGQLPEAAEIFGPVSTEPRHIPGPAPEPTYTAYETVSASPASGTRINPAVSPESERPEMPSTYLVWAIITTLCCCIVTGIVAIVYASKVSPLYNRGDFAGAQKASERAGWWVVISFVAGLIWTPFYTLYSLLTASV